MLVAATEEVSLKDTSYLDTIATSHWQALP